MKITYKLMIKGIALLGIVGFLSSCGGGGGGSQTTTSPGADAELDRTKWADLERVNLISNGVLVSALRRFGSSGSNSLNFIDPVTVAAIEADVTVTDVANTGATPRARLSGYFYDDGTVGAGDIGEVFASIEIRHDGTQLVVIHDVFACNVIGDENCDIGTELLFDNTTFGPVALGETHTLSIAWDEMSNEFTFGYDGATNIVDTTAGAPFVGPSQSSFKAIGTRISGISDPDEGGSIAATFDNVMVNSSAYDNFE